MNPVTIHLSQLQAGVNFASVSIPFAKGIVTDCDTLAVYQAGEKIDAAFNPSARWIDGSIKWCVVKISLENSTSTDTELSLQLDDQIAKKTPSIVIDENTTTIAIKTNAVEYTFDKNNNNVFPTVITNNKLLWNGANNHATLINRTGTPYTLELDQPFIEESDELSCVCIVKGKFYDDDFSLNAQFRFEILPNGQLELRTELHNPKRAIHPGGIWDLGDPGSVFFQDFHIALERQLESTCNLKTSPDTEWSEIKQPAVLFQASSGGENWDSPVHVNANNKVCNKFKGYKLTSNGQTTDEGLRSSPVVAVSLPDKMAYTIQPVDFWQNFPKSIDLESNSTLLRFFPLHHGDTYELQGGERKTHEVLFQFLPITQIGQIATDRPIAKVDPQAYKQANVIRYFDHGHQHAPYEALLEDSLAEVNGFFDKREKLDEYGWRNFGEIYADHETAYHKGDDIFVSHYNNQYDPIYGFAKRFALTGDVRWYKLMSDLAKHVLDIDVYRTEEDRLEYNNGLFWHTDHYAPALTATHRTYSKEQVNNEGILATGGGPHPQHCYSSGLAAYYFLTGNKDAKDTVLGFGEWMKNYHDGTGTLLETAKNTLSNDSKTFIKTCKGSKVFKYRYPMDRGTGNYLRTLMDCFDLTSDTNYLDQIENIIQNTAGPHDDINARGFEDVEYTWFYVIFLQEVVRYLDIKRALEQMDDNFYYARGILLHYATWMLDNAEPYLHSPEKLQHPNATWIAQEPRKVQVLHAAYMYALKDRKPFLEKAKYIRDYIVNALAKEDTLYYARIQILLLQNQGPASFLDTDSLPHQGISEQEIAQVDDCFHTPASHAKQIAGTWFSSLSSFKIRDEIRWYKSRTS